MGKDFDKMSDEEFMEFVDNIDEDESENDENINEDTDQETQTETETETETETNQKDDDFFDDTDEDEDENEDEDAGENSQDEENNSDEQADDDDEKAGSEDKSAADEGKTDETVVDYKKAYEEALAEKKQYEDFYKEVTSEFIANGKVMKGFNDPKKIIQAQQMAAGFSDKMKAFKQYRPFINPLKEKGIIDDPEKFNLLLSAMDGDKEAIKKMLKSAEIDPVELDMENINYKPKNQIMSEIEMAYEDVAENAEQYGVRERVEEVITKDWDDQSVIELLEDPESSADLVNHLSNGVYDLVQEKIAEKKMTDPLGTFSRKRAIDQYREAAEELENEYIRYIEQEKARLQNQGYEFDKNGNPYIKDNNLGAAKENVQFSEEEIQAEMNKIIKEKEYASMVEKRNAEADRGRRKAASITRRKPRSKKKENTFDPGQMSDEEFTAYVDSLIL